MILIKKIQCCICLLVVAGSTAQEAPFFLGRLLDRNTGEPVVFATIRIQGQNRGVISNEDGSFRVPFEVMTPETVLEVSSMGYVSQLIQVSEYPKGMRHDFYMDPGVWQLDEAVAASYQKRSLGPRAIVRRAIRAIPANFPVEAFSLTGYYRDYQKDPGEYVNLNEAILEVYDAGFQAIDSSSTRARIYQLQQNGEFKRDSLAGLPYDYDTQRKIIYNAYLPGYGGNEFSLLRVHDPIRNHGINAFDFINKLDRDLLAHHSFEFGPMAYLDGEPLYKIHFNRKRSTYHATGTMYVSPRDFAIHRLDYAIYRTEEDPRPWVRGPNPRAGKQIFGLSVEYRRNAGKMYLNYISFQNNFTLRIPPEFRLLETAIDYRCLCMSVQFSGASDSISAMNADYKMRYRGKRIPIKEVIHQDKQIWVVPDLEVYKVRDMFNTVRSYVDRGMDLGETKNPFRFEVNGVRDRKGNLMNEWKEREFLQFREFFVQEVKPAAPLPEDGIYMEATQPVFLQEPADEVPNGAPFWMNPPLREEPDLLGVPATGSGDPSAPRPGSIYAPGR